MESSVVGPVQTGWHPWVVIGVSEVVQVLFALASSILVTSVQIRPEGVGIFIRAWIITSHSKWNRNGCICRTTFREPQKWREGVWKKKKVGITSGTDYFISFLFDSPWYISSYIYLYISSFHRHKCENILIGILGCLEISLPQYVCYWR